MATIGYDPFIIGGLVFHTHVAADVAPPIADVIIPTSYLIDIAIGVNQIGIVSLDPLLLSKTIKSVLLFDSNASQLIGITDVTIVDVLDIENVVIDRDITFTSGDVYTDVNLQISF